MSWQHAIRAGSWDCSQLKNELIAASRWLHVDALLCRLARSQVRNPVIAVVRWTRGRISPPANVSFDAPEDALGQVTSRVERAIAQTLGPHEPIFVRSALRLMELAAGDDFERYLTDDVHERCVFLAGDRRWDRALPMSSRRNDVTLIAADGPEVFSVTRWISGRAGNPGALIERQMGAPVTTRNWNTIERILRAPA